MARVYVAGSINMDVVAKATRYPELGETVPGTEVHFFPGGKGANQAVAAAKLGGETKLIGRVGRDGFGRELKNFLSSQGVDLSQVQESAAAHTGTAMITIVNADNAIVVVPGANGLVDDRDVSGGAFAAGDVLVSQFEIPVPTVRTFFSHGRSAGARTVLNPAPAIEFDRTLLGLVDVLILNESELSFLSGRKLVESDPVSHFVDAARSLRNNEKQTLCVTLGPRGCVALIDGDVVNVPGRSVTAIDTTGAGDCFVGAFAAQLAAGEPLANAMKYANGAASICVQRMGAGPSMPTKAEVANLNLEG
jgi:ribokinase